MTPLMHFPRSRSLHPGWIEGKRGEGRGKVGENFKEWRERKKRKREIDRERKNTEVERDRRRGSEIQPARQTGK